MFKKSKKEREGTDVFSPKPLDNLFPVVSDRVREVSRGSTGALFERVNRPGSLKIEVDLIGLAVMDRLDGTLHMEALIEEFAAEHLLSYLESRALIMPYVRTLVNRDLVVLHSS